MTSPPSITSGDAPRLDGDPAALVLDLDGTCIDSETLFLHPRVRDAVRAATRHVPVIIATGRMYRSALPWCRELHVTTPAVCYQGAMVREQPNPNGSGRTLLEERLAVAAATRALHVARGHDWHVQVYRDDELFCEQDRPEAHYYTSIAQVPITFVDDLEPLLQSGVTKMLCVIMDPSEVARCMATMSAALRHAAHITRSLPQFVEIVSPKVSKAAACDVVCKRLSVDLAQSVAIGDSLNDIEVLDAAGYAVAISSSPRAVLAHADATCERPRNAGVADALAALNLC